MNSEEILIRQCGGFKNGHIPHNKKYDNVFTTVSCHVCSKSFDVETKWYHYRIRKGKSRFACQSGSSRGRSDCCKKLQSLTIKEIRSSPESRAKTSDQMKKRWRDPVWAEHFSEVIKSKPPEWHQNRMAKTLKTCLSGKMTKPEIKMLEHLKSGNLPFKYVGDGSFWIGMLNPDFISTDGSKRVIEVFGCYWHGCQKCLPGSKAFGIPKNQRLSTFKKHGWSCEIVWEHDIKLNNFEIAA
jgi:G:T-mismatch repair DNA endonuclease (very short patch repair protein)